MFTGLMLNTWITATIVAVIAGMVGFFAVLRGQTFAAHAIPNGAFAGAAGASLLGINVLWGLAVFAIGGALGIGALGSERQGRRGRNDVVTALGLVLMLGLGALFISVSSEYAEETYALLFGEVFGISQGEVLPILLLGIVSVVAIGVAFRPLMLTSALPEVAEARGVSTRRADLYFLVVMALATSMTVPGRGRAADVQPDDRPGRRRPLGHRPAGRRARALGRHRARHGLDFHRPVLPDQLAARLLRRGGRRGLLPPRPGRPLPGNHPGNQTPPGGVREPLAVASGVKGTLDEGRRRPMNRASMVAIAVQRSAPRLLRPVQGAVGARAGPSSASGRPTATARRERDRVGPRPHPLDPQPRQEPRRPPGRMTTNSSPP